MDWLVGAFFADEKLNYHDGLAFGVDWSAYANTIASGVAAAVGGGFAQLGAATPPLEAGAAQLAAGAAGFAAGLAPFLPPGFAVPQLSASLPSFPAFPFSSLVELRATLGRNFLRQRLQRRV